MVNFLFILVCLIVLVAVNLHVDAQTQALFGCLLLLLKIPDLFGGGPPLFEADRIRAFLDLLQLVIEEVTHESNAPLPARSLAFYFYYLSHRYIVALGSHVAKGVVGGPNERGVGIYIALDESSELLLES